MNCEKNGLSDLRHRFLRITDTKIEEGIFVGPQTRCVITDKPLRSHRNRPESICLLKIKSTEQDLAG